MQGFKLPAVPIRVPVEGAPFQPGQHVLVVQAIDPEAGDVSHFIGSKGVVDYLEYSCGCSQSYPHDPMIGVRFDDDHANEFWPEELRSEPVQ